LAWETSGAELTTIYGPRPETKTPPNGSGDLVDGAERVGSLFGDHVDSRCDQHDADAVVPGDALSEEDGAAHHRDHRHERLRDRHVLRVLHEECAERHERGAVEERREHHNADLPGIDGIRVQRARVVAEHAECGDRHQDDVGPGCGASRESGDDGPAAEAEGGESDEKKDHGTSRARFYSFSGEKSRFGSKVW
jgi:hypothetical protein